MKRIYYIILLTLFYSCAQKKVVPDQKLAFSEVQNYARTLEAISLKDSLLKMKPTDFLRAISFIKLDTGTTKIKYIHNIPFNFYIQKEWVTEKDVAELMTFIYDRKVSQMPLHRESSCMPDFNSTKGVEAMRLIRIYRDSTYRYPTCSGLNLSKPEEQEQKAKELDEWWKKHKAE
jgi:hypothetical protein